MKARLVAVSMLVLLPGWLICQSGSINNTLGSGGTFSVKDGSATFLTVTQSDGYLNLNKSLTFPSSMNDATIGVIFKGTDRFIHSYRPTGTMGSNTFVGLNAGNFTMAGTDDQASYNTAVGQTALTSLTTGKKNSAFGSMALYNDQGGSSNSAFGNGALTTNVSGSGNCAFGYGAAQYTTTDFNSAFGFEALCNTSSGSANCAFGFHALTINGTGNSNAAFGYEALNSNSSGKYGSAVGRGALYASTADSNTAIGYNAGRYLNGGSNNTFIGAGSGTQSSFSPSNTIWLGNASIATLYCNQTSITSLSDARDKKNVRDLTLGLDFLMSLRPRQFNWDRREWYANGTPDGSRMKQEPTAGFIAQELDEAQSSDNAGWLNLVDKSSPNRLQATPGNLLPVMVKAIQELKAENDALKAELRALRASIAAEVKNEIRSALTAAGSRAEAHAVATDQPQH